MSRVPSVLVHSLALSSIGCVPGAAILEPPLAVAPSVGADRPAPSQHLCDIPAWDPPHGLVPEVHSVSSAAVTQACEQLVMRARAMLRTPFPASWRREHDEAREARRALEESGSDEVVHDPLEAVEALRASVGTCVPAGTGAWSMEPTGERFDEDEGAYTVAVRFVHIDSDGSLRVGPTHVMSTNGEETTDASLRPVFDFDGDGRLEATLRMTDASRTQLFTATDEEVREVTLPLEIGTATWIDYDADGRPDLLADRLYTQSECYEWRNTWGMPSLLLHASEGLTFSADDAVARRYAQEICPCPPTRLLAPPRYPEDDPLFSEQTLVRVACARLWGVSVSVVALRLESEIDALPSDARHEGDVCASTVALLTAFAERDPPLRLDR